MASGLHKAPGAAQGPHSDAASIPGQSLRQILLTLQASCGQQYEPLLKAAGLARFLHSLPPDDWNPAGTTGEVARLFKVVYDMLGEELTRLFHRNNNLAIAEYLLHSPRGQQMIAQAAQMPPDQRLGWFVRETAVFSGRTWTPHTASEDADAWYLTNEHCLVCAGVQGAAAPFCGSATLYAHMAKAIVGRRVRVVEVECAAMGAPHCKYALYK
jgi:V4R domain